MTTRSLQAAAAAVVVVGDCDGGVGVVVAVVGSSRGGGDASSNGSRPRRAYPTTEVGGLRPLLSWRAGAVGGVGWRHG